MAKKQIDAIKNANSASIKRSQAYAEQVRKMFAETVNEILELQKSIPELEDGQMFSFDAQPIRIQKEVEVLLRRLSATATLATQNGIKVEWDKANDSADALLSSVMGKAVLRNPHFSAWTNRNQTAMQNFITRKEGIMTLSDRIWQSTRQLREEMEVALTVGIGEGKSSAQISRDVRKYLNDPDLMFRRFRYKIDEDENGNPIYGRKWKKLVKDEDGKKHWIDYDKDDYKVGAGMYKSSAKNAMRVARTETNMAYKRADQERYKKFDFILGYHIEPSHNHEPEDCEPDICEQLKGDYPKWFTWEGWHPQCKCQCTPIMMDEDEAIAMFNARDKGKKYTPKGMINEMPQQFKDWCENNKEKIVYSHQRGKDPYFVRHNFEVVKSALNGDQFTKPVLKIKSDGNGDVEYDYSKFEEKATIEGICHELKDKKLKCKEPDYYKIQPSEEEIITNLTNVDPKERVHGACVSLALAYCGNKAGLDMLDNRDGYSVLYFQNASTVRTLCMSQGGEFDTGLPLNIIRKNFKENQQYFCTIGGHASIMRKLENVVQYLELQPYGKHKAGWYDADENVINERFEVENDLSSVIYIPIENLAKGKMYRTLMGYINTKEPSKKKKK